MKPRIKQISPQKEIVNRQKKDNTASRRRLLGGVFILFCMLVVLLKVTSNIKPLPINPSVVEIQANNQAESSLAPTNNNSSDVIANNSNRTEQQLESKDNPELILNDEVQANTGFKAGVIQRHSDSSMTTQTSTTQAKANNENTNKTVAVNQAIIEPVKAPEPIVKPKVAVIEQPVVTKPVIKAKASPSAEDLLNDTNDSDLLSVAMNNKTGKPTANSNTSGYYLQLAALSSEEKANNLKQELVAHGVNVSVQSIQTPKGTLYRLKSGPYTNDVAKAKLQQLNSSGYSGIIVNK